MDEEKKIWLCPADNTYNSGNFCIRCGRPRAEEQKKIALQDESAEDYSDNAKKPLNTVNKETEENAEETEIAAVAADETTKDAAETAAPEIAKSSRSKKSSEKGLFKGAGEKVSEFCGDVAAHFSRLELVRDIKASKRNRNIAIAVAVGVLVLLFVIFGLFIAPRMGICVFGHRWIEADCTHPVTCIVCGKQKGELLPHDFSPATCTEPSVCRVCGEVGAEALDHDWAPATCTEPAECRRCGEHNGENLGHIPGDTRISIAPTVMEPGEEEILCRVCGEVMGTQPCGLKNYIEGSGFTFTVLDYSKLLLSAKENILPDINMLKYTDKTDYDCFAFWLGTEAAATEKVASCMLFDENMELILLSEENYEIKPYVVRWIFDRAWDHGTIEKLIPYILSTLAPAPIDGGTLLDEKDMTVDGLRYIYENNGITCRLTVLTSEACSLDSASKLFG